MVSNNSTSLNCLRRSSVASRALLLGATMVGFSTGIAHAQEAAPFEARWEVVSAQAGTTMRCDASIEWYAIADIPIGTPLYVIGEEFGWYEVRYPIDTPAVVPTREGVRSDDGSTVELIRRSGLRAWSIDAQGIEGMYKRVFPQSPLAPGTELQYIADVTNLSGDLAGWRVVAPLEATGFIPAADVRRATDDEIAQAEAALREARGESADDDADTDDSVQSEDLPSDDSAAGSDSDAASDTVDQEAANEDSDVEESQQQEHTADESASDQDTEESTEAEQGDGVEALEMGTDSPAQNDTRGDEEAPPVDAFEAVFQRLDQLDAAMLDVADQPTIDAELDAIMSEWKALASFADEVLTDGVAKQIQSYAQQRVDLLAVRLELQRAMQQVDELDTATDTTRQRFRDIDRAVEQQRTSVVYGVLESSRVYDGVRLEKRYRLRALDGSGRTIAYIRTGDDEALTQATVELIGQAVGVSGTIADDSPAVPVVDAEAIRVRAD